MPDEKPTKSVKVPAEAIVSDEDMKKFETAQMEKHSAAVTKVREALVEKLGLDAETVAQVIR